MQILKKCLEVQHEYMRLLYLIAAHKSFSVCNLDVAQSYNYTLYVIVLSALSEPSENQA